MTPISWTRVTTHSDFIYPSNWSHPLLYNEIRQPKSWPLAQWDRFNWLMKLNGTNDELVPTSAVHSFIDRSLEAPSYCEQSRQMGHLCCWSPTHTHTHTDNKPITCVCLSIRFHLCMIECANPSGNEPKITPSCSIIHIFHSYSWGSFAFGWRETSSLGASVVCVAIMIMRPLECVFFTRARSLDCNSTN